VTHLFYPVASSEPTPPGALSSDPRWSGVGTRWQVLRLDGRAREVVHVEAFAIPLHARGLVVELGLGGVGTFRVAELEDEADMLAPERRLARAGRAHDRGQAAVGDVEGDAAQRLDAGVALAVAADELRCRDGYGLGWRRDLLV